MLQLLHKYATNVALFDIFMLDFNIIISLIVNRQRGKAYRT